MGEIYGESPRPWTFVIGKTATNSEKELIESIPGTVEHVDHISNVRQENFDAAIVFGNLPATPATHLMVMKIGGSGVTDGWGTKQYLVHTSGNSTLLTIETESAPEGVSTAELRELAELIRNKRPHALLRSGFSGHWSNADVTPIIREKDGSACVGWWRRPEGKGSEFWWFPRGTPGLATWRSALYARWNKVAPLRFPNGTEDWTTSPDWITAEEISAMQALKAHDRETEEIVSRRTRQSNVLKREIASATEAANSTTRLLLTAQGKQLVDAVESTLSDIGFTVIDSDEQKGEGAYLLEDLKITHEDWVCLAEVRGYAKGAKTSDLQRIERAVRHYERGHGTAPSARWYVVNHNLRASPSSRPAVLSGATDDIEVFAEENGLVVDTRDLFRLARDVREARLSSARARELLMTSSGVLAYPSQQNQARGPAGDEEGDQAGGQTEQPDQDTSGTQRPLQG
ncbi:hypothetical protein [Streptomyces sp. NRRL F-5122]|uniref:hypothetical protein n=1 Tax=Streptomyces sp. NRRL F-5122 TaxID=1609098 RepID=UPI000AEB456A|nr:hypothetical protein [Streptomyces sp. NRRL F-5122]